jgi:hypothetical protein
MNHRSEYHIMLTVTPETRRRLDMVRMILDLNPEGRIPGTWNNVVEWLVNTVPVDELLADLVRPQNGQASKGINHE